MEEISAPKDSAVSIISNVTWARTRLDNRGSHGKDDCLVAVGLEAFMYKHQGDLEARLKFAWQMHDAPAASARAKITAWDAVVAAAADADCTCKGQWIPLTEQLLQHHCRNYPSTVPAAEKPESGEVRKAIVLALQKGAYKHTNVFLYGPNTTGKTHVLKPLAEIFKGTAFLRPVGRGSFPLQGIFGKKVCILQDVRVNTFKLGFDSLLVWFEGEPLTVPMPRNLYKEDREYSEQAPIFISSGSKFQIPGKEAQELSLDPYEQNEMMDARFRFFHFPCSLSKVASSCHNKCMPLDVMNVPHCPQYVGLQFYGSTSFCFQYVFPVPRLSLVFWGQCLFLQNDGLKCGKF